jgi:hypothetical protein
LCSVVAPPCALRGGKVDAYYGDAPVVAFYITHNRAVDFGGKPVNSRPVGSAFRKGDALIPKARKAVKEMYADGTMKRILEKWNMSTFARSCSSPQEVCPAANTARTLRATARRLG